MSGGVRCKESVTQLIL
uniref:Uncharacterized protein n=1 Tax=Arundo donax TaxID=35708 RepID=A0A0A8ZP75_ARUDO